MQFVLTGLGFFKGMKDGRGCIVQTVPCFSYSHDTAGFTQLGARLCFAFWLFREPRAIPATHRAGSALVSKASQRKQGAW